MAKRNCCRCRKVTVQHKRWMIFGLQRLWYCVTGKHVASVHKVKNWG